MGIGKQKRLFLQNGRFCIYELLQHLPGLIISNEFSFVDF